MSAVGQPVQQLAPGAVASAADIDTVIAQLRMRADPLADAAMASLLAPWDSELGQAENWRTLAIVNAQLADWQINGAMRTWKAGADVPAPIGAALEAYVARAALLPDWADTAQILRAEELFIDYGMLSCTLLFCSSLPECYVIPDLAAVLHVAGQLEQHTEYRVRATAAMIFPVMMIGGLTSPEGGGVAQVLKVRLIHATIRNLILRGDPALATRRDLVPPLDFGAPTNMHQAMFAHGWDLADEGMPCSQDELAYTLLTFGYVFLRSLRKLGLGLAAADERAYLHAWNVMGHVLGMERSLMADTMEQAAALFERLQARGRAELYNAGEHDPRPSLGQALMATMENVIPLRAIRPFPVLLTRYLCGKTTAKDLGIDHRVSAFSRILFVLCMGITRGVDALVRVFLPEFSICRMITRIVGYQFTVKVLMDQTRPLKLPPRLLNQVAGMTEGWKDDPKAPAWINNLEHRLTGRAPLPAKGAQK